MKTTVDISLRGCDRRELSLTPAQAYAAVAEFVARQYEEFAEAAVAAGVEPSGENFRRYWPGVSHVVYAEESARAAEDLPVCLEMGWLVFRDN